MHAEYQLGSRMLNGRQVKLSLVAEVCDPGDNPLSTHSKPMPDSGIGGSGKTSKIDDELEEKAQLERP